MFTGIIKETGTLIKITDMGQDREFTVRARKLFDSIKMGDSISVNGVCFTVKGFDSGSFYFDVSASTLKYSDMGSLKEGDRINLEDSLSQHDKIGGHFVSGHVDAVSSIIDIVGKGRSYEITFSLDSSTAPFIAPRGSITVDGISLTVIEVSDNSFKTVIIPYTYKNTTLGTKGVGERVNIEVDMLARYVVNYLSYKEEGEDGQSVKDRILKEKLENNGFIR